MENEVSLRFRILYYPFMGTNINTERIILCAKLCYSPLSVDQLYSMVQGEAVDDEEVGRFIRGLISSGHLGALEHWHTTFAVEGYSRISSQQNDRHRLMKVIKDHGVPEGLEDIGGYINAPEGGSADISQLQQSQRYVKESNFRYIVPPSFERSPEFLRRFRELQEEVRELVNFGLSECQLPAEDVRFSLTNATETRFVITTNARQLRHMFNLRCCTRAQWEIRQLFNGLLKEYRKIAPNIFYRAGASCEDLGYCPEGRMSCGKAPTMSQLREAYAKVKDLEDGGRA